MLACLPGSTIPVLAAVKRASLRTGSPATVQAAVMVTDSPGEQPTTENRTGSSASTSGCCMRSVPATAHPHVVNEPMLRPVTRAGRERLASRSSPERYVLSIDTGPKLPRETDGAW